MEDYTAKVTLRVTAKAFNEEDMRDLISDLFSPGENTGVNIEKCEINFISTDG